jgi:hypothetical protein
MQQSVFTDIVAKVLILVDAIIGQFVVNVTYTPGSSSLCIPAAYSGGDLTACGWALVLQLPLLAAQGIGFLNNTLVALGIS